MKKVINFVFGHIGAFIVGGWIIGLLILCGVAFVAIHFIAKFW